MARKLKWYASTDDIIRVKATWKARVQAVTTASALSTRARWPTAPSWTPHSVAKASAARAT